MFVYLDNSATTKTFDKVNNEMYKMASEDFGNPSSLHRLGLNAEDCIYIDDRIGNLNAAKRVGMNPILLNSRNVSYDGVSVDSFEELDKNLVEKTKIIYKPSKGIKEALRNMKYKVVRQK